jgi:hypothetical protein
MMPSQSIECLVMIVRKVCSGKGEGRGERKGGVAWLFGLHMEPGMGIDMP